MKARYIAVEGPPGAGVGPLAERLAARTGARLFRDPTQENPFLEGFSKDPKRFAFQTQLFFLLSRYRQQGEMAQMDLFARGGVVADYCFARDRLWARLTLSADELSLYDKIHALLDARGVPRPDLVVYLTARPEVLRARLSRRVKSTDRVVEAGLIDEIAQAMSGWFFRYDGPLLVVNTSEVDQVENEQKLDEILAVIQRTKIGVNHYNM
jgi:deoxyadenosine/deoxycytidine kinase